MLLCPRLDSECCTFHVGLCCHPPRTIAQVHPAELPLAAAPALPGTPQLVLLQGGAGAGTGHGLFVAVVVSQSCV